MSKCPGWWQRVLYGRGGAVGVGADYSLQDRLGVRVLGTLVWEWRSSPDKTPLKTYGC